MKFAEAKQAPWQNTFPTFRSRDHRAGVDRVIKTLIPDSGRGKKIIRGMQKNGWAIIDIQKAGVFARSKQFTFERAILSADALKHMGWQA